MSSLPAIDAPHGVYRERALVPARTALLSIDMQNGEFNADILARAMRCGSGGDDKMPALQEGAWKSLGLKESELDGLLSQIGQEDVNRPAVHDYMVEHESQDMVAVRQPHETDAPQRQRIQGDPGVRRATVHLGLGRALRFLR